MSGPTFATIMSAFIGKPFLKGGHGPDGYDCIGFIHAYCRKIGAPVPDEFEGWTLLTYPDLYTNDLAEGEAVMMRLFDTIGVEIPVTKKLAGDILVVRGQRGSNFPAVYTGNGQAVSSFIGRGVEGFSFIANVYPVRAWRVR